MCPSASSLKSRESNSVNRTPCPRTEQELNAEDIERFVSEVAALGREKRCDRIPGKHREQAHQFERHTASDKAERSGIALQVLEISGKLEAARCQSALLGPFAQLAATRVHCHVAMLQLLTDISKCSSFPK
jgi:hypothetical protein